MWTSDCSKALIAIAAGTKGALKQQKKKQVSYLNKLTAIIRGQLSKVERNKVVALITMEIHNRDVTLVERQRRIPLVRQPWQLDLASRLRPVSLRERQLRPVRQRRTPSLQQMVVAVHLTHSL